MIVTYKSLISLFFCEIGRCGILEINGQKSYVYFACMQVCNANSLQYNMFIANMQYKVPHKIFYPYNLLSSFPKILKILFF